MAGHSESEPVTSANKFTETRKIPNYRNTETRGPQEAAIFRPNRIRKTSISMPSNLDEMESLRIDRQKVSSKSIRQYTFVSRIQNFLLRGHSNIVYK